MTLVILVGLTAWSLGQTSRATPAGGLDRNPSAESHNLANPGNAPQEEYVVDELLVGFRLGVPGGKAEEVRRAISATEVKSFPRIGAQHWRLPPGLDVARAVQVLSSNPNVRYAEPNYIVTADAFPNDASRGDLWGLHNLQQTGGLGDADIDAPEAWDVSTGSGGVVGVIDSGIDYMHEDLAANIWTNPNEIANNLVDDDNNGYVDDVRGWDFVNHDNDPMDDYGHGTHTAGTIGAVGNNGVGVAGVSWNVKLMPLKFLNASGTGTTADATSAVLYAASFEDAAGNNVVRVTNNSWGGGKRSSTLQDALASAGALFVASAGNSANSQVQYPAGYPNDNIISVAATDHADGLAPFSNFGSGWVDLGAPGVNIVSTYRGNQYRSSNGTSMAAPHVAGAAALVLGTPAFAGYTNAQVKDRILSTVDPVPALLGKTVTGGRLNVKRSLNAGELPPDGVPPSPIADLAVNVATEVDSLALQWTATGDDGGSGTAYLYDIRYATTPIVTAEDFAKATAAQGEPIPGSSGDPEAFTLRGLSSATTYYLAARVADEVGNSSSFVTASAETATSPWVTQTVDGVGNVGFYNALAYDAAGNPAIGYSDETNDDVKLARSDGSSWDLQTVDAGRDVQSGVDLAFDPVDGNPSLSYGWGKLKFAHWNGSSWAITTIERSNAFNDVTSLVYDPNRRASISYRLTSGSGALKLARWTGSGWTTEVVDAAGARYNSLAYDLVGNPSIAYSHDVDGDNTLDTLRFAYRNGSAWALETVETGVAGYGVFASLAYDPQGNPGVVHAAGGSVRFLRKLNGAWRPAEIVGSGSGCSIAYAPSGVAYVSYLDRSQLKVARRDVNGAWTYEVVESGIGIQFHTSTKISPAGTAAVSYCISSARDLKFARRQ